MGLAFEVWQPAKHAIRDEHRIELAGVDSPGFVVGPISVTPLYQQDTVILPETLTALVDFTDHIGIDLYGSAMTLDAEFDSQDKKEIIKTHHMQPVIYPNRRTTKTPIAVARMSGNPP